MGLGHDKLDVNRLSMGYVAWVYEKADSLNGFHRSARDQWLCASQSIPLNIAKGNGKTAEADRRRYFESELDRMVAMLTRLGGRGYCVKKDSAAYGCSEFDPDSDFDPEVIKSQTQNSADE